MDGQSLLVLLLMLQSILYSTHALSITSVVEKSCIVDTDKGQLDLTSLASSSQDPAFQDLLAEPGGSTLSIEWNPCKNIQPSGCDSPGEIFSAESIGGQSECQKIGAKSDAKFGTAADSITLSYPGGYVITFACTQGDTPSFKITDGEGLATTLSGKASCLVKKPTPGPKKAAGLSTGSVLCIIFAVILLIYILVSMILMVTTRNDAGGLQRVSNGNMELIRSLLNNIKAGFLFSFSCCGKRSDYGSV